MSTDIPAKVCGAGLGRSGSAWPEAAAIADLGDELDGVSRNRAAMSVQNGLHGLIANRRRASLFALLALLDERADTAVSGNGNPGSVASDFGQPVHDKEAARGRKQADGGQGGPRKRGHGEPSIPSRFDRPGRSIAIAHTTAMGTMASAVALI
jgi:hypothetical protein